MQTFEQINRELMCFLDGSPTPYHAVENMAEMLKEAGYEELFENRRWKPEPGKGYYVRRNGSALIAFAIPEKEWKGFRIIASHSDSPALKVKAHAGMPVENQYVKLNVEGYGGMLMAPWMDRPLSVAGRIAVRSRNPADGCGIEVKLVNIDRDLLIIPNLAIHMNRKINDGYEYNLQRDMLPLFAQYLPDEAEACPEDADRAGEACSEDGTDGAGHETGCAGVQADAGKSGGDEFLELVAEAAGVRPEDILDMDMFLYNRMKSTFLGKNREFIAGPGLDDLQCAFASLKGFLEAEPTTREHVAVHCVLDNEEVGSSTKQGAASTFLKDVLHRINAGMGRSEEEYLMALSESFMVSADNAHSVHPNHTDKADPTNRPYMNRGIVIKYSANQKYTTDAVSGAMFRCICEKAGVPYQIFHNRSDMAGGSTLGNISNNQVALRTVDIGLPQLAMHSCYETAGSRDTLYLEKAAKELFSE